MNDIILKVLVGFGIYYFFGFFSMSGWYIENIGTANETKKNMLMQIFLWPFYLVKFAIGLFK